MSYWSAANSFTYISVTLSICICLSTIFLAYLLIFNWLEQLHMIDTTCHTFMMMYVTNGYLI